MGLSNDGRGYCFLNNIYFSQESLASTSAIFDETNNEMTNTTTSFYISIASTIRTSTSLNYG